jgi:hypothetical protein
MRELSGAIAVSALFQVIVGFGGKHPSLTDLSISFVFAFIVEY